MQPFVAHFECTTFLTVPEISGIDAAVGGFDLDFDRSSDVSDELRAAGSMPEGVVQVLQAYATGENDDWEDGELKTFFRVSLLVTSEDEETIEDIAVPDDLLREVYTRAGMTPEIEGAFVMAEWESVEGFEPRRPDDKDKIDNRASGLGADAPSV